MSIEYCAESKIFNIKTKNTSYVLGVILDKDLVNLHYGKKIDNYVIDFENLPFRGQCFAPNDVKGYGLSTDTMSMEYPCYGSGDLRTPAFHAEYENGSRITKLEYDSFEIFKGKKKLSGLPVLNLTDHGIAIS